MSAPPPAPSIPYGVRPEQIGNLHLPATSGGPWPCVILIHGGFWRIGWDRTLMTPLAIDLARRGVAAWNIEYRRVGHDEGGWPGTLHDVAAAVDFLADIAEVDADRVATCGHSAGGQLALWAASRPRLARGSVGADPSIIPVAAVSQAGVADLIAGADANLGDGAVQAFLGGSPASESDRYEVASPARHLPLGIRQLLVHGDADDIVPPTQSTDYGQAARRAGDDVEIVVLEEVDHFDVADVDHSAWNTVAVWLAETLGTGRSGYPPRP